MSDIITEKVERAFEPYNSIQSNIKRSLEEYKSDLKFNLSGFIGLIFSALLRSNKLNYENYNQLILDAEKIIHTIVETSYETSGDESYPIYNDHEVKAELERVFNLLQSKKVKTEAKK
ncbi:MAG: hypothetical protein WC389_16340 [Lutibacter sp.]|jgi:hypothetical protein